MGDEYPPGMGDEYPHDPVGFRYPLVICYIAIENDHRNSGFSH